MSPPNTQELVDRFTEFYQEYYRDEITDLAQAYPDDRRSLYIDWADLFEFDPDIAEDYRSQPHQLQDYAAEALRLTDITDTSLGRARVRVHNLPEQTRISDLRSKHINTVVGIYGTVTRVSEVVSRPEEIAWECQRCGALTRLPQPAQVQTLNDAKEPPMCQGCEREGPYRAHKAQSVFRDAQSIVIREPLERSGTDDTRASIVVDLNDDLTGEVTVGDHLLVTGALKLSDGDRDLAGSVPDKYLDGQALTRSRPNEHITLTDDDKREIIEQSSRSDIYDALTASIAPTIEGYDTEKLTLLLQLFSGVRKELPDGRETRGDIHVLLVGDPGTAKTVIAKQAARLAPRAALVDGSDTSAAGLTSAAAVSSRSAGGDPWTIEGGIIAMANEGLACIDNFDQLNTDAQTALHGVLEHQEINASKATEKRSIPAQTSVLATANPKYGRFDEYEPIAEQLDFPPQVISEFDLLFTITDKPDRKHDERVADRVLETQKGGELAAQYQELDAANVSTDQVKDALDGISPQINHELLRKYIAFARQGCYPTMTEDAKETIKDFYVNLRSKGSSEDAPVPMSARKLEALVRLTEASARVRLSDEIKVEDAERVIDIVEASLQDIGVDPETGEYDADVVETGTSKSQRDRIKNIKELISNLQDDPEVGAPAEKVMDHAEEMGMSPSKVEQEIEKLKHQGELYEPEEDHFRTT